jgi:hypothetical protein
MLELMLVICISASECKEMSAGFFHLYRPEQCENTGKSLVLPVNTDKETPVVAGYRCQQVDGSHIA